MQNLKIWRWTILMLCVISACQSRKNGKKHKKLRGRSFTAATCGKQYVDIVFGLGISYSMRDSMKRCGEIIQNTIELIKGGGNGNALKDIRVGVFLYKDDENELHWGFPFTNELSPAERKKELLQIGWEFRNGNKYGESHSLAIRTATKELLDNKRDNVSRIIVLVTDGEDYEPNKTIEVAKNTIVQGISIFALGITTERGSESGLDSIVGGRRVNRIFSPAQISELSKEICRGGYAVDWKGQKVAEGCDFSQNDLERVDEPTGWRACQSLCEKKTGTENKCSHFVWSPFKGGKCWMKKGAVSPADSFRCKAAQEIVCKGIFCGYL